MARRKGKLAGKLAGTRVAARGSDPNKPDAGYAFVQTRGQRAGQSYNVKRGASGMNVRKYETGDTAALKTAKAGSRDTQMAGGRVARNTAEGFVQKTGPRANQSYSIGRNKQGQRLKLYDDGSRIPAPTPTGTAGARAPRPAVLRRQQESDIADTAAAAELYRRFLSKQRPSKMGLGGRLKIRT